MVFKLDFIPTDCIQDLLCGINLFSEQITKLKQTTSSIVQTNEKSQDESVHHTKKYTTSSNHKTTKIKQNHQSE